MSQPRGSLDDCAANERDRVVHKISRNDGQQSNLELRKMLEDILPARLRPRCG
jgi:hypothetical protein